MRALQAAAVPANCKACGKTDLASANNEVWEFYLQYPSLVRTGLDGSYVDYPSALHLLERGCYPDPELMLQKLEAIRQGFSCRKQTKSKSSSK